MSWLKYYFLVAVVYLVIGSLFQITNLLWFASYFPREDAVHSIARGIAFYHSLFYAMLLLAIVVWVMMRLGYAALWLADVKSSSEPGLDKQRWLLDNGLSLSFARIVQSLPGLLLPPLVPVFFQLLG